MKSRFTLPTLALSLLSLAGCALTTSTHEKGQPLETSSFYGDWRVAGVAVSDTGVQALEDNDPSLVGRRLSFTPGVLAWDSSASSTEDACKGPVFNALSTVPAPEQQAQLHKLGMQKAVPYGVRCESGNWGPLDEKSPTFFLVPDGSLALLWYDGGMLKLLRSK